MKKKFSLVLLLLMMVLITVSLVACNNGTIDDFKKSVEINGDTVDVDINSSNSYLKFSFPKGAPSVFSSLWVKDREYEEEDDYQFDIADVKYSIVYTNNNVTTEIPMGYVSKDMVANDDIPYLEKAGHHVIHVSTLYKGKQISGSFTLHLKDHSAAVDLILLTFDLSVGNGKYAYATFGETNEDSHSVNIKVEKGVTFASWNEFITTFTFVYENVGDENNMALIGIENKTNSNDAYGLSSTGSFTISKGGEYKTIWTNDTVTVNFNLQAPNKDYTSDVDPNKYFDGKYNDGLEDDYKSQVVAKGVGVLARPDANHFNVFRGYYFAGWYTDPEGGSLWAFSSVVGNENRTLYGQWRVREYSAVIYTMGGDLESGITSSLVSKAPITADSIPSGYQVVSGEIKNSVGGSLAKITLTGLTYTKTYDKYIVKINNNGQDLYIKLSELLAKLDKGGQYTDAGNSKTYKVLNATGLYTDYTCLKQFALSSKTLDDIETYVLWEFNDPGQDDFDTVQKYQVARSKMLSLYYTRVLYKDAYTIKADGTVRFDTLKDDTLHFLEVPALLWIGDKQFKVTEFAKSSTMNAKGLVTIDFSKATNLETIGENAFAHDIGLSNISGAENTKVETVGNGAFYDTAWENNYSKDDTTNVLVFNNSIYKYVGPTEVKGTGNEVIAITTLDLTEASYASVLDKVSDISDGAFASFTTLQKIVLPATITSIQNGAFEGLKNLTDVELTEDATTSEYALSYVGESAFNGCTKFLSKDSVQYVAGAENAVDAIILGNVYYKSLTTGTKATIPSSIKYIAPCAFENSGNVENVTFQNETAIEYVGEDAFYATKWIAPVAPATYKFTQVNGTLISYYASEYNLDNINVVIPDDIGGVPIKKIGKHAFNSYAQYVTSIQFSSGLEEIEEDAFIGAISCKTFVFDKATIDTTKGIKNIPVVSAKSFTNSKGELINGVKFYFAKACIDKLKELTSNPTTDNAATLSWLDLYGLYKDNFDVEEVAQIRVNKNVVANLMLKTTAGTTKSLIDDYLTTIGASDRRIDKGIVVETTSGIKKYETLTFNTSDTDCAKLELIKSTGTYASLFDKNLEFNQYVIVFTRQGSSTNCQVNATDPNVFIVTEYYAASGIVFNSSNTYPENGLVINADGYTKECATFWFEEISGDIEDSALPTFYTNNVQVKPVFKYKDINGITRQIKGSAVTTENFSIRNETGNAGLTAYINVNFYNLGKFRFSYQYKAQESKIKELSQTTSVSIPLNADWSKYLAKNTLNIVGENKSVTPLYINSNNFDLSYVDIDTTTLGMSSCNVEYNKTGTVNGETLRIDLVYSIVLEADPTAFEYEVLNETDKTARIKSCSASSSQTIILPTTCEIKGKTYSVVAIGYNVSAGSTITGVFEDFTSLETVYLSETIKNIGTNTFKGCSKLKQVYTAKASQQTKTGLYASNFDILSTAVEQIGSVEVTNYQFAKIPSEIVLPQTITEQMVKYYADEDKSYDTTYTLTLNYAKEGLFSSYTGTLFVPYTTDIMTSFVMNYLNNKLVLMASEAPKDTDTVEFVLYDGTTDQLEEIVANNKAVTEAKNKKTEGSGTIVSGTVSGSGAVNTPVKYQIAYTLDKKTSTAQSHFVYDIEKAQITKIVYSYDAKLKNLAGLSSSLTTIAIGLKYEMPLTGNKVAIYTIKDIAESLSVSNSVTTIYIPDSIHTLFTIKNAASETITPIIYASSSGYMFDTEENLPASLEYIGATAFYGCDSLSSLDFSKTTKLSYIEGGAFMNAGLTSLDLSKTALTELNAETFKGCYKLGNVVLSTKITKIGRSAFSDCDSLMTISGYENVTFYGRNAFNNCISLLEYTLSANVITVENGVFAGDKALTIKVEKAENVLPAGWDYQWYDRFNNAVVFSHKTNNKANDGNTYYVSNGIRYIINTTNNTATVAIQAYSVTNVTIPTSITYNSQAYTVNRIIESAFEGCDKLETVTISSSIKTIEARAFYGCRNLKTFSFSDSNGLSEIVDTAFTDCDSLTSKPKVSTK